jgi:hypothetical protein
MEIRATTEWSKIRSGVENDKQALSPVNKGRSFTVGLAYNDTNHELGFMESNKVLIDEQFTEVFQDGGSGLTLENEHIHHVEVGEDIAFIIFGDLPTSEVS